MTPERLTALIKDGETLAVEFKSEEAASLSDRTLVETVVCLANRSGDGPGWLLVGVEDDGRISGARPRHETGTTDPIRVQALIANRTRPSLSTRVKVVSLEGQEVLVIEVPVMRQPLGTADGHYLRRAIGGDGKPACVPFHFHEMQALQADRGLLDYSALRLDAVGMDALDPLEFERYRRTIRENRTRGDEALLDLSDLELAKALGAVEEGRDAVTVRVLGLLLFGREEELTSTLPGHEVAFQMLFGTQVEANDFFRWPLLRVVEEMQVRFRAHNREQEILVGMTRIGVPNYSERAFREGLANALIHRDYTRLGPTYVQWREDRIEISSPGGFPLGVRLDNLLVTEPRPRSPLLADAFKRAGIVERTARGIDTIFYEQLRNGRPAPSYERSTEAGVTLILPGGEANLGFVRFAVEEAQENRPLSLDELLILTALEREQHLTIAAAAATIQKGKSDAENLLRNLAERGLVHRRGAAPHQVFQLAEAVGQRLVDYTDARQGRTEPIQPEEMVRRYVEHHGSIARKDAADLCSITSPQAYRLLKKMALAGVLRRVGAHGRNVRYERNA